MLSGHFYGDLWNQSVSFHPVCAVSAAAEYHLFFRVSLWCNANGHCCKMLKGFSPDALGRKRSFQPLSLSGIHKHCSEQLLSSSPVTFICSRFYCTCLQRGLQCGDSFKAYLCSKIPGAYLEIIKLRILLLLLNWSNPQKALKL